MTEEKSDSCNYSVTDLIRFFSNPCLHFSGPEITPMFLSHNWLKLQYVLVSPKYSFPVIII